MPGVSGIIERPESIHSGKSLRANIKKVAHRSDQLMEAQIETVQSHQDALHKALFELEASRQPQEIEFLINRAKELNQKTQDHVIILQVVNKLNTELMYARYNLQKALRDGCDPNVARKRVVWLEDRMQHVCWQGEPRAFSRAAQRKNKSMKSTSSSPSKLPPSFIQHERLQVKEKSSPHKMSAGYIADYNTTTATSEPSSMSESDDPANLPRHPRHAPVLSSEATLDNVPHSDRRRKRSHRLPSNESSLPGGGMPHKAHSDPQLTAALVTQPLTRGTAGQTQGTEVSLYPLSVYTDDGPSREVTLLSSGDLGPRGQTAETDRVLTWEDQSRPVTRGDSGDHLLSRAKVSDRKVATGVSTGPDDDEEEEEIKDLKQSDALDETFRPAFITEDSSFRGVSRRSQHSRVTFKESEDDLHSEALVSPKDDPPVDAADLYWQSEHHRLQYSNLAQSLCELNPLSYHGVGLAIPGTFVEQVQQPLKDLPWKPTKKGEILDIHRRALDKLHAKVYKMYKKVQEAAMLSVELHHYTKDTIHRSGSYLFRNMEVASSDRPSRAATNTSPAQTMSVASRPQTRDTAATNLPPLIRLEVPEEDLPVGHLVYYPKPLLHPEVLPVTKTNKSRQYPSLPATFGGSDPAHWPPAERMANQGNLHRNTQFVLYKGKTKSKTSHQLDDIYLRHSHRNEMKGSRMGKSMPASHLQKMTRSESRGSIDMMMTDNDGFGNPKLLHDAQNSPNTLHIPRTVTASTNGMGWSNIKPRSGALEHSGIKWERIKDIIHTNIKSPRREERRDAVQQLAALRGGDTMVVYALKERMVADDDDEVQYEATKALVTLGCWDEDVLVNIVKYLMVGNQEIQTDLLHCLIQGKNVQHVNKDPEVFPVLLEVLSNLCKNPDQTDSVAFDAAIALCMLCVADENAKERLRRALVASPDVHVRAQALSVLVRQLQCTDQPTIQACLMQIVKASVWKYRREAARSLGYIGPRFVCQDTIADDVFAILERRLWDEQNRDVRCEVAKTLVTLGMEHKAQERAVKRLDDPHEDVRSQAVTSVGTLGVRNEKTIRNLLEMLDLDPSEYVRLMVIRAFASLGLTDKRVIRALKDREKLDGPLARASAKALKTLLK